VKLGRSAARTDPGRKRRGNEDSFVCRPPLFAIADGMGGARAGEVASALAAGALEEAGNGSGERHLRSLIQEANRRVHERASTDASTSGMGTTITAALVVSDGSLTVGHVGDSRAYRLRGDRLEQLTDDHSLVGELVRRGELSPEAAEVHPQRSVITRALGTDPDVDVDTFPVETAAGDVYLICSDGLSDMVDGETIERILRDGRGDLDTTARELVQAANRAGGEDNITAILFEIVEGTQSDEPDEQTREIAVPRGPTDDEDTLHPEDGVAPPPPLEDAEPAPTAVDTMVVPAADIDAAMSAQADEAPQAGIGRRFLALLVIAALIVLIVALVLWGLAR
jgi:serine/threonine protein phosphatase PrpC